MAKFAADNNESTSTKLSLLFAIKSFHPDMSFDIVEFFNVSIGKRIFK